MNVYRVFAEQPDTNRAPFGFYGVLKEAHEAAKGYQPYLRDYTRIELVDVDTSKAGVLRILSGDAQYTVLRTWCLTSRGGLKEVSNGE
jgi:hypothetical protein